MPPLIVPDIKLLIVLKWLSGPCKNQSQNFFIYSRPGIELELSDEPNYPLPTVPSRQLGVIQYQCWWSQVFLLSALNKHELPRHQTLFLQSPPLGKRCSYTCKDHGPPVLSAIRICITAVTVYIDLSVSSEAVDSPAWKMSKDLLCKYISQECRRLQRVMSVVE